VNDYKNHFKQKGIGLSKDIFISILIAIPFAFIDFRTALSIGTLSVIILLIRRMI